MNRNKNLDLVAGILIVWMIVLHVRAATGFEFNTRFIPFLFCFMAWFFFKSGMFHRLRSNSAIIKSGWKILLIPIRKEAGCSLSRSAIYAEFSNCRRLCNDMCEDLIYVKTEIENAVQYLNSH